MSDEQVDQTRTEEHTEAQTTRTEEGVDRADERTSVQDNA